MAAASSIRYAYLAYAAKPAAERLLYRRIRRQRISRIVEVGVANMSRTRRLIEVAQRFAASPVVSYTGMDWFDARGDNLPRLPLIQMHRQLAMSGAKVRLVPGSVEAALAGVANCLTDTDLVVIAEHVAAAELEPGWFFLPRMLHAGSLVYREQRCRDGKLRLKPVPLAEVEHLATAHPRRRQAA